MELREFVARTLVQIVEGVSIAAGTVQQMNNGARVNPMANAMGGGRDTKVEFDVVLGADGTVAEPVATAGEHGEATKLPEARSRVRFEVVITHPTDGSAPSEAPRQDYCWMT